MKINEWFDIGNIEHIKAYYQLQKCGTWSNGFIPDNVSFDQGWQIVLMHKFANAYIEEKISSQILYKDGEPCEHRGCRGHTMHPCEVCGRFRAQGEILEAIQIKQKER